MATGLTRVRDVMTKAVLGIAPTMRVVDALAFTKEHAITHLPVCVDGRAIGVVCICDLERASLVAEVSTLMHSPPVSVDADAIMAEAAAHMAEHGVGSLLVMSDAQLSGIVTRSDFERIGLAEAAFGEQRCSACRGYQHVHLDPDCGYYYCVACRAQVRSGSAFPKRSDGE